MRGPSICPATSAPSWRPSCGPAYSVLSRRFGEVPTDAVAGFCLATCAPEPVCHLLSRPRCGRETSTQWLALAALGIGPVGAAFYVWDIGMKRGDIRFLGVASYATPVLSTLLLVAAGYAEPHAHAGALPAG